MKVFLSKINLDIFNKRIDVICNFVPDAIIPVLDNGNFSFEFKPYSKDEIQTLQFFSSLPQKAALDTCIFVSEKTEEPISNPDGSTSTVVHERGVYRYVDSTYKWQKEPDMIYFGNQIIAKCLEKFAQYKTQYSLPDTELDYTDVTAFIGSIDYSKVFN